MAQESEGDTVPPYVSVSVLPAGWLTLPEHIFCDDQHDTSSRISVPSLSFLVRHLGRNLNIVFDLGMRKKCEDYSPSIRSHIQKRLPVTTDPDVSDALRKGGLQADQDVDIVVLSHVHYDHVGTPSDFPKAHFVVGYGTRNLLENGMKYHSAASFERNLLPAERTIELSRPNRPLLDAEVHDETPYSPTKDLQSLLATPRNDEALWKRLGPFDNTIDLFGDGSVHLIDSPGHIPGHLNLLAKVSPSRWVYLAGDACHHGRILKGQAGMATWRENGMHVCIHVDKKKAEETLGKIRQLNKDGLDGATVEVVLAHDGEWLEAHQKYIWPGTIS